MFVAERVLGLSQAESVTVSFLTLGFAQLWHVFNMRSKQGGLLVNEVTRNPWVWGAIVSVHTTVGWFGLCSGHASGARNH